MNKDAVFDDASSFEVKANRSGGVLGFHHPGIVRLVGDTESLMNTIVMLKDTLDWITTDDELAGLATKPNDPGTTATIAPFELPA